jgi:hypothetical protein
LTTGKLRQVIGKSFFALMIFGLLLLADHPAYADTSAKSFFEYKERAKYNKGAQKSLIIYLDGIAAGVNAAETLYFQKFDQELLCPPADQVIDDEEILAALELEFDANRADYIKRLTPASLVAVKGLMKIYPCEE